MSITHDKSITASAEHLSSKLAPVLLAVIFGACSGASSNVERSSVAEPTPSAQPEGEMESDGLDDDAAGLRVALTFDDLGVSPASVDPEVSRSILATLAEYDAPSAVFANCKELDPSVLAMWQEAGAELGNHTATHPSIDELSLGDWSRDVTSCDETLRDWAGQEISYFRYPYLRYGETEQRRDRALARLGELGYTVAHVSAATSEWLLAAYYERALALEDVELQGELVDAYVEHMIETLEAARSMAFEKVGRDIAHITLFHVNQLAASHLHRVLAEFDRRGYELISLAEALSDPVYQQPDHYAGGCGCSWLARIAPPHERGDAYFFGTEQRSLSERFGPRIEQAEREKSNVQSNSAEDG
jgi:peptidoglycan-N-acetylglucosamine deacetylase